MKYKIKEYSRKIWHWIVVVLSFLFKYGILLMIGLSFFWQYRNYFSVYKFNQVTIWMLLPFLLFFLWLWWWVWRSKKLHAESLLTLASIIIAVLFFLFQYTLESIDKIKSVNLENENKINAIRAINIFNCNVATSTVRSLGDVQEFEYGITLLPFVTDIYMDNLNFVFEKWGGEIGVEMVRVISQMQVANSLISITQGLDVQGINSTVKSQLWAFSVKKYNDRIIDLAKEISQSFICKSQ